MAEVVFHVFDRPRHRHFAFHEQCVEIPAVHARDFRGTSGRKFAFAIQGDGEFAAHVGFRLCVVVDEALADVVG